MRIALNSGLSRTRVASDLGIGKSTLAKWIVDYRPDEPGSGQQADPARENERLRVLMSDADIVAGRDEVLCQDVGLAAKILRVTRLDLFGNPASLHDIASVTMCPSRIPATAVLRGSRLFYTVRNPDATF